MISTAASLRSLRLALGKLREGRDVATSRRWRQLYRLEATGDHGEEYVQAARRAASYTLCSIRRPPLFV